MREFNFNYLEAGALAERVFESLDLSRLALFLKKKGVINLIDYTHFDLIIVLESLLFSLFALFL
jgi:hypothetical protein